MEQPLSTPAGGLTRRSFVAGATTMAGVAAASSALTAQTASLTPITFAPPGNPQFLTLHEIVAKAKEKLSADAWAFISGGADTETTILRNRLGLDSLEFVPDVFVDVHDIDTSATFLGQKLTIPVMIAPIGSVQQVDPNGVLATASVAAKFGTIAYASVPLAQPDYDVVMQTVNAPLVAQLYVFGGRDWLQGQIDRAKRAGCVALGVTADTGMYGRRERDLANRYFPRDAHARQLPPDTDLNLASMNWETLAFIRRQWKGPLSVKGIVNPKMARRAVEAGANVIHISNHGGRQLDFAPGTITVLGEIVKAVGGHADVVIDSGFVRGSDVVKALALGAKAVLIGKMQAWALAAAGADGLLRALQILEIEMRTTMALIGAATVGDIRPDMVRPGQPVRLPSVTSAFPYLT